MLCYLAFSLLFAVLSAGASAALAVLLAGGFAAEVIIATLVSRGSPWLSDRVPNGSLASIPYEAVDWLAVAALR